MGAGTGASPQAQNQCCGILISVTQNGLRSNLIAYQFQILPGKEEGWGGRGIPPDSPSLQAYTQTSIETHHFKSDGYDPGILCDQ